MPILLSIGLLLQTLTGHTGWVYSVAISNDCKKIITASWDNTIRISTVNNLLAEVLRSDQSNLTKGKNLKSEKSAVKFSDGNL